MFNIGSGEIALIAVVALLILGPTRLPELARGIGKFMREFRRQTDEVRGVVEREFYKMDTDLNLKEPPLAIRPANDSVPSFPYPAKAPAPLPAPATAHEDALPTPAEHVDSQLTKGMPASSPPAAAPEAAAPVPPDAPATKS